MNQPALVPVSGLHTFPAIFGKHATAADHIEDMGLSTPALAAFKQQFYVDALGTCITRSVWTGDLPAGAPPPYDHSLLTVDANGWIAARFVCAQDASGRAQFPLVACLHGLEHEALRASGQIWSRLESQIETARRADNPARLRQSFVDGQQSGLPDFFAALPTRSAWAMEMGEGLMRVAHALSPGGSGVHRARVPLGTFHAGASALFWASFLSDLLPMKSITLVWRAGAPFADLMLSSPNAALFHSLFSPESKVPLTTTVPFSITAETRRHAAAILGSWQSAERLFTEKASRTAEMPFFEKLTRDFRGWFQS